MVPRVEHTGAREPGRFAVIDLGSNTARLVVYDYEPGRGYRRVDEIREQTRLGEGLAERGALGEEAMERALAAMRLYADYARATGLEDVHVLATSAVRDASNRRAFLDRLTELGFRFDVLTGRQEAVLGVLAVANGFPFDDAWVMDLGGGSVQISLMRDRRFVEGHAYPLGAVRATEAYLHDDPPTAAQVAELEAAVDRDLGERLAEMRGSGLPLVAMGGTVRNLARAVRNRSGYTLPAQHGYLLTAEDQADLTRDMLRRTARKRGRISGISSDRGDIILAGALVYRRIVHEAGLPGIHISGYGVRDGALFRVLCPDRPHLVPEVRQFAVDNLLWRYPQPRDHIHHVRKLALRLFEGLAPLHGYGEREADLLGAAALLHDVGSVVGYLDHHKHGAYLLNSTALRGYTHREQALLTLLVRYHRRGKPRTAPHGQLLDRKEDGRLLLALAACLRLAEYLETSRSGRVSDVEVDLSDGKNIRVTLVADGDEPWAEFWEAQKRNDLFRKAFKRKLVLAM